MINWPNLYYFEISKKKLKKEYTLSSGTGKNTTSYTTLHLEGQTRYFTVWDRRTIKLDINKIDSKFTIFHQCSLERSYAVLTEINPEFWSRPIPFLTKTDSRRVVESFSRRVRFSKFRPGLLKYYMLNLISDFFKIPSCEYMCK